MLLGPPRTGKSSFIVNMVESYRDDITTLYIVSPSIDSDMSSEGILRMAEEQHEDDPEVTIRRRFDASHITAYEEFIKTMPPSEGFFHMLILEDVIGQLPLNSPVWGMLSRWRHLGLTVILASQKMRGAIPKVARTLASCWILLGVAETEAKEVDEELAISSANGPATKLLEEAKRKMGHYAWLRWMPMYGLCWASPGDKFGTTREALVYEKNKGDFDDWQKGLANRSTKPTKKSQTE